MPQTILSVVLDVDPQSAQHLSDLIEPFKRQQEEAGEGTYSRLKEGVPSLHFLSMSVFQDAHYDPIFVIEANFDGPPGRFWAQMEAALAIRLRPMLRCCKRPADDDGPVYDAVTKPDSRYAGRALPAAQDAAPQRLSSGQPGTRAGPRSCARASSSWRPATSWRKPARQHPIPIAASPPRQIHAGCATRCCGRFRWLATPAPARISSGRAAGGFGAAPGLRVLPLSSAFRFPAWRWRRSPRPGGSRS